MTEAKNTAILLATYNPPKKWFAALLDSLDAQTYPNLHLYVRDDASPEIAETELLEMLSAHLHKLPYSFFRNERNLGSNGTFARLVKDCAGEEYVSFCDQDDVWDADKVERSVRLLENSPLHPVAVCTDLRVIDGDGKLLADSMTKHRKRHIYLRGEGLAPALIYRNFLTGCATLTRREWALSCLPFPDGLVHDHYLAFRAACDGAIDFDPVPSMSYRVYGGNQTGVMTGVRTKRDYYDRRIAVFEERITVLERYADFPELREARAWCDARKDNYFRRKGGFRRLWKQKQVNRTTSLFELFALRFPSPLFRFSIRLIQKRIL